VEIYNTENRLLSCNFGGDPQPMRHIVIGIRVSSRVNAGVNAEVDTGVNARVDTEIKGNSGVNSGVLTTIFFQNSGKFME
jgi:hypothetical protein